MDVWILQWDYPYDMDSNITVWTTQKAAQEQALKEINEKIDNSWDMDDADMFNYAEEIEVLEGAGKLKEAIDKWNDYQMSFNDEHAEYYNVLQKPILGGGTADASVTIASGPYQASSPGATCRGSHKEYNPYAHADRADGTYLCTQCKTFGHIFGTNNP